MSETKYESKIGTIPSDASVVYAVLGNLNNVEKVRGMIPPDKVQELEIEPDCIRMKVEGLAQKIAIRIVDREPDSLLKFGADNLPVDLFFWIQLKQVAPGDTRIKLTIKADIPMMFRMMLESKIKQGLDQAVDMLCQMPYALWKE